ncbi:hypothetical protein MPP7335_01854 [Mycolicibacterium parafortuitum]|uniref:Uncharacterized protein n=1 Tax=Mycolicibacterium parafortuitum TaxID=39692 RepID=A0A375YG68_MYCPF|nr:hypothetical protein MPP7335_01854 [Mycolicibacterium parafortuitum]
MCLKAEPLSLEWDRPATRKRVKDGRRLPVCGLEYLCVCLGEEFLITDVFPHHQALDELVQALAFFALQLLGREFFRM